MHAGYDSWLETFRCLGHSCHDRMNRPPPVVVTSYTREEAEDDFDKCVRVCVCLCVCVCVCVTGISLRLSLSLSHAINNNNNNNDNNDNNNY